MAALWWCLCRRFVWRCLMGRTARDAPDLADWSLVRLYYSIIMAWVMCTDKARKSEQSG